jgi:hypothetical protein
LIGPIGAEPTRIVETQSYLQSVRALAGRATSPVDEYQLYGQTPAGKFNRGTYAAKSDFFDVPLSAQARDTVIHHIERGQALRDLVHACVTFDAFGGAINRVHSGDTAFVHRSALFNAQYLAYWQEGAADDAVARCMLWLRSFHRAMRPHANGGAYVNYVDPELAGWPAAYYGSNHERLVRVKARYDPDWVFRLPQGIPPR